MLRLISFNFVLFLLSAGLHSQESYIDYRSPFHPVVGNSGMVVSQNKESSDIGIEILEMGGNAIDAAVAVGFSLAITLPRAGNLGGGGFLLVYLKEKDEIISIDYRGASSKNVDLFQIFKKSLPDNYDEINRDLVRYGYFASTVPGTVAGLLEAHERYGKLSLDKVIAPVIKQAREGIIVSYDLHHAIKSAPQLYSDPESRRIYFSNEAPLAIHSLMKRPDLADTLSLIAENGKDGFYRGEIAQKIAKAFSDNEGFISVDDLVSYKARIQSPISTKYRGNTIFTQGPPSGGGVVLINALNVLESFNLNKYKENSAVTYHLIAEALRKGHHARSRNVGDPEFYDVPISSLIDKKHAREHAQKIKFNTALPASEIKPIEVINESRDTTHYSIIDKEGNAISNTYTLGYSFGSGVTIPGTGILMNNQMNNFAFKYGDASEISRSSSPGNKFEPGKRPMSTMNPVIVKNKDNGISLITGSPGGSFIPAAALRVISGIIDFDLDIGEATMLPRIHKDWPYSGLTHESSVSSDIIAILNKLGHEAEESKTMGSTQSIHIIDNIRYGYADLRRPNSGVAIQID